MGSQNSNLRATISPTLGYCLIDSQESQQSKEGGVSVTLYSAINMEQLSLKNEAHSLRLVQDWQVLEAATPRELFLETKRLAMLEKAYNLTKLQIQTNGKSESVVLLEEVEAILSSYKVSNDLLNRLMIAPYSAPSNISDCARTALGSGLLGAGQLLNSLFDLQPLLLRFSELWLNCPEELFEKFDNSKQELWEAYTKSGTIRAIIEAPNAAGVKKIFTNMAFDTQSSIVRMAQVGLGHAIAQFLYGDIPNQEGLAAETHKDDGNRRYSSLNQGGANGKAERDRALSEIDGIVKALSNGENNKAQRFLKDLIDRQTSSETSIEYAVKSLCNLAKQCSDMFRTDFEFICLDKALKLSVTDSWTMVQLSDHYKRKGDYVKAEEYARSAIEYGAGDHVGESLLADIASQQGEYTLAIQMYRAIQVDDSDNSIATAIADNLRRLGNYDEALSEYNSLESQGVSTLRITAGRAEIAKKQGDLNRAISIYKKLIDSHLMGRDWWLYRQCYASVLTLAGHFRDALIVIEDVIDKVPFSMSSRVMRSSLVGILGDANAGLLELPKSSNTYSYNAYGEWINAYTRGLLLLQTNRYHEAREDLLECLEVSVLAKDERVVLRAAAALSFIVDGFTNKAKALLIDTVGVEDDQVKYLMQVLNYHILIQEEDESGAEALYQKLSQNKNVILWEVVQKLRQKKLAEAVSLELVAMHRLAA